VCVYVYNIIYTYILHTHICMYTYIYTYIHIYIHTYIYIYIYIYIYVYIYIHIYIYIGGVRGADGDKARRREFRGWRSPTFLICPQIAWSSHVNAFVYVLICMYLYMYAFVCMLHIRDINMKRMCLRCLRLLGACICIHMYAYIYIYIFYILYVYMYICWHIYAAPSDAKGGS
jgi:hypothetical protein